MKRHIELYGRLREHGSRVAVDLPEPCTAKAALAALAKALPPKALSGCALATEKAVLGASDRVPSSGRLAVLPPVCGG